MKFYIEASELVIYKTIVDAKDRSQASEKFWEEYSDLTPTDIKNATINFIAESQR